MTVVADPIEYFDDLLAYIEDRRVIPILGPELVTVEHEGAMLPIDRYLAIKLAEALKVQTSNLPPDFSLSNVVAQYTLYQRGRPAEVPPRLLKILEQPLPTPEPLKKLARIKPLRLFVTTTFDRLLEQAINEVRFAGADRTRSLRYGPKLKKEDIETSLKDILVPTVFHLFGRASSARDFVITEEDTLEFLHALQSESRRPTTLFDELNANHLLFIGCRFPDWLARFVLRMTRRDPLSPQRDEMEVMADGTASSDQPLTLFLDQFSYNTKVFPGSAIDFVDTLAARWAERFPDDIAEHEESPNDERESMGMRPGSVFISYASEDREAAVKLSEGLTDSVDVWLDQQQLRAGFDWDAKIRHNIRQCSLFVPVISRAAAARVEGYFRAEWLEGIQRGKPMDRPFVVPVAIDDLPNNSTGIPDYFWSLHVARLPNGEIDDDFRKHIVALKKESARRGPAQ